MALSRYLDPVPTSIEGADRAQLMRVAEEIVRAVDSEAAHELHHLIKALMRSSGMQQPPADFVPTVALIELFLFDLLSQQEALTWIRQHFVTFLPDERIDLFRQIRLRLMIKEYDTRGEEKETIRRALASSEQSIGQGTITIDSQPVAPTVANWITAYRRSSQVPKRTNIDRSEFLFDDATAKALDEPDRNLLADTLYMYDVLGLATDENGALDTPDPGLYLDEDEDINSVEALFNPLQELLDAQKAGETPSAPIQESSGVEQEPGPTPSKEIQDDSVEILSAETSKEEKKGTPNMSKPVQELVEAKASTSSGPFRGLASPTGAKYMTVQGLREAGGGFSAAMQASIDRAVQLAQDPAKKADLLSAFKQTDTYNVYLEMGSESVDAGIALAQVSQERQQMKKSYLLPEEFEAVSQFMRVISL